MSVYESSITNPKKQLEFYKQLSEQLQHENKQLKEKVSQLEANRDKAIEFTNKNWGTWCTHHLEYMTELQDILKEVE